jgi:hypothetical protein
MTFTAYKGNKKLGTLEAKDLDEAEKIGNKQYPDWTEIYIGKKKEY